MAKAAWPQLENIHRNIESAWIFKELVKFKTHVMVSLVNELNKFSKKQRKFIDNFSIVQSSEGADIL